MRGQQGAVGWAELQVIHGPCEEVWAGGHQGNARGLPMRLRGAWQGRVGGKEVCKSGAVLCAAVEDAAATLCERGRAL